MRIDLFSIFPEYFAPVNLSLLGKAHETGLVDVHVHDLRDWTHDAHRTVDDTPYGGGAGMVMMPTVWGEALDEVIAECSAGQDQDVAQRRVLAIPTPSGIPLTQGTARNLTNVDQLMIACGRYEGIDQRVADHYRASGVEVLEYSIGDYVLNGGEVAALVLVEAVTRLLDGFMGNPQSLEEESHENGLLEYPTYTKPRSWRDIEVPDVLLSGDHGRIERWRRDLSLKRTLERRPDLIAQLQYEDLDSADKEFLAASGHLVTPSGHHAVSIRLAQAHDGEPLATLAARTFPDACPDFLSDEAIAAFIGDQLSPEACARFIAQPERYRVLVAEIDGELGGYTLSIIGEDAIEKDMVRPGRIEASDAYLSKCYTDSTWRGSGLAGALLEVAVADVEASNTAPRLVLATNTANLRAQKFYKKHGFKKKARRTFNVGGVMNLDVVLVRNLTVR